MTPQVFEVLGESEKSSFYFDDCCFSALGILFAFTCVSLFLNVFRAWVELVRSVRGSVCALNRPGGGNNMHSVLK